jgi:hypothetical protein
MALSFDQQLEQAGQHVMRARAFHDLMWFYNGIETRSKIIGTMNKYSEFFRWDEHAHLVSFVIYISRFFENNRNTINIHQLLKKFRKQYPGTATAKAEGLIKSKSKLIEKIKKLRNEAFAHMNSSMSYNDVFKLADIQFNELRNLTEIALHLVNFLRAARHMNQLEFYDYPLEDAKRMFSMLSGNRELWRADEAVDGIVDPLDFLLR